MKHGVRLRLVNLYTDEVGNAALPSRLRAAQAGRRAKKVSRNYLLIGGAVALLALLVLVVFFSRKGVQPAAKIAEKSIAVLPFANTSEDPATNISQMGYPRNSSPRFRA